MDVALIPWPAGNDRTSLLATSRVPRLLLVAPSAQPPPLSTDVLEDWIRLPASPEDIEARVRALVARMEDRSDDIPVIHDGCTIVHGTVSAGLSPLEARLAGALVDRFGAVVGRRELARAGWPAGAPTTNTLDVAMGRLRRVLEPLGLRVRSVRSRGFLLDGS